MRPLELVGERVAIRARRAALDMTLFFPRAAGGQIPRAVIGHRTLDAKQSRIEVGDNQEERLARVGVGHALFYHEVRAGGAVCCFGLIIDKAA